MAELDDCSTDEETDFLRTSEKEHNIPTPGVSELTSAAHFERKCTALLRRHPYEVITSSEFVPYVVQKMGISESRMEALKEICKPELLYSQKESAQPAPETPLNFTKDPAHVLSYYSKCQEFSITLPNIFNKSVIFQDDQEELQTEVPDNSVILWIDVFHPIKKVRDHGFIVLASQLLTDLRDAILCPNDYMWTEEMSESPEVFQEAGNKSQKINTPESVFFFINNTFYNDRRIPCHEDTSRRIIEWTTEKPDRIKLSPALDHYESVDMKGVEFHQLQMRLGFPYLYSHGGCDHLIMVRDVRLFNPRSDVLYKEEYPRLAFWTKIKHHPCCVCEGCATWLTCDDELAPESPSFFCHDCFLKLHYSADRKKMCEFKAYRYQFPDNPTLSARQ